MAAVLAACCVRCGHVGCCVGGAVKSTEGVSDIWVRGPFLRWRVLRFRVRVRFTYGSEFTRSSSETPSGFDRGGTLCGKHSIIITPWPLQAIRSLRSFIALVNHPFILPPPSTLLTLLRCHCTTNARYATPHPSPLRMPYTIQYWQWQCRVNTKSRPASV